MNLKPVVFTWKASEESEAGHAIYSREGATFLSLDLPTFKHAHAISLALDTAMKAAYHEGVETARATMHSALKNL